MSPEETVASNGILKFVKRRSVVSRQSPASPARTQPSAGLPSRIAVRATTCPASAGIATFTTDLCDAISTEYGSARLFAVLVNDTESGNRGPVRTAEYVMGDPFIFEDPTPRGEVCGPPRWGGIFEATSAGDQ